MQPSLFTVHGAHEVSEAPWPEPWLVYTGDKENAERRARLQWAEAAECPACATAAAAARAALWPKQPHALKETRPMQASAGLSPGERQNRVAARPEAGQSGHSRQYLKLLFSEMCTAQERRVKVLTFLFSAPYKLRPFLMYLCWVHCWQALR